MRTPALLLLVLPWLAAPALASSPAAWRTHDAKVRAACLAASGLRQARASAPVRLSDRAGTAMLVTGVWPQAHMKGARGTMLCLYDRGSGKAEASEAPGWSAPTR